MLFAVITYKLTQASEYNYALPASKLGAPIRTFTRIIRFHLLAAAPVLCT